MQLLPNLSAIADRFDAVLLDLWGVVHDGTALYPGAREALGEFKRQGKKIVLVSNAPRRAHKAIAVLRELGVADDQYQDAVTSGEAAYEWLKQGKIHPGKHYYFIGAERDAGVLDGLDFKRVDQLGAADFLLTCGFGTEEQTLTDWSGILRSAQARDLEMLCLNPDIEVVKISGGRFPCAGTLAREYKGYGGRVRYFGKPYAEVYELARSKLPGIDRDRLIAIGDGLHTDILGANTQNITSVLITGGILQYELGEGLDSLEKLAPICAREGGTPDYVMTALRW